MILNAYYSQLENVAVVVTNFDILASISLLHIPK
jgi:hypothetical protein